MTGYAYESQEEQKHVAEIYMSGTICKNTLPKFPNKKPKRDPTSNRSTKLKPDLVYSPGPWFVSYANFENFKSFTSVKEAEDNGDD